MSNRVLGGLGLVGPPPALVAGMEAAWLDLRVRILGQSSQAAKPRVRRSAQGPCPYTPLEPFYGNTSGR